MSSSGALADSIAIKWWDAFVERKSLVWSALTLLALMVYGPSVRNYFIGEDLALLPMFIDIVNHLRHDLLAFLPGFVFRPIYWLYYAGLHRIFGLNPSAYRLVNILVHGLNGFLVFLLAKGLLRRSAPALLSSVIFTVYYVQSDTVIFLATFEHCLGGTFFLSSLLTFLNYLSNGSRPSYCLGVLLFAIALFTNPSTVSLIPTLAFLYMIPGLLQEGKERSMKSRIQALTIAALPFALVTASFIFIETARGSFTRFRGTVQVIANINTFFSHLWFPFGPQNLTNTLMSSHSIGEGLQHLLWLPNFPVIVLMLISAAVTLLFFTTKVLRGSPPERVFSGLVFTGFLPFLAYQGISPRYFYLPLIGVSTLLATQIEQFFWSDRVNHPRSQMARWVIMSILIFFLALQLRLNHEIISKFHRAGLIVRQVVEGLSSAYGSFPDGAEIFVKGVPRIIGKDVNVFNPGELEHILWWKYANPSLQVSLLGEGEGFPPMGPSTYFFTYTGTRLEEVRRDTPR